ncbi:MAG: LLM class flavin-dependent oxidoreductase [Acidobacteria bacterium]|nr:LLM class flavin-dependent oxidoreductase [Acidobacteriota bacterium]
MFLLRFDMRAPTDGPAEIAELYAAALDMAEWADAHDALSIVVSEHHRSPDGYLPSPLVLAAAMAARTSSVPISISALLLNLYDPIKLAEDIAVLDIVSGGRVTYTIGLGYRPEEYAMFGVDLDGRGDLMDTKLAALLAALAGETFEYDGRSVEITPKPISPNGPMIFYGGHSPAAMRRAGRFGLGVFAEGGDAELEEVYIAAAHAAGHEPSMVFIPSSEMPTTVVVADDVDAAWEEFGPYMLRDARAYAAWLGTEHVAVSRSDADTVDALRSENGAYRIVDPDEAVAMIRSGHPLALQPLVGGCPPELAWTNLRCIADRVLPQL